jgi:hypothetical protein
MNRTGLITSALCIAGLCLAFAAANPMVAGSHSMADPDRERERNTDELKQATGLVVDLHHYLSSDEATPGENADKEIAGSHTGGPMALLTAEEGMIRTSTQLHVILFASKEDAERHRDQIAQKIGERVRITGHAQERDGIKGIAIKEIAEVTRRERTGDSR